MHYIKRYILDKLIYTEFLRNRDMRPPNVESNLYQYHLKELIKEGYILKNTPYYTLALKGLRFADLYSSELKKTRPQPKLITISIIKDQEGHIALIQRDKQPFIGTYHLPSGKIHEDETAKEAAERELVEKLGLHILPDLKYCATTHVIVSGGEGSLISEYYAVVFSGLLHHELQNPKVEWYLLGRPTDKAIMPGVLDVLEGVSAGQQFIEITESI